MRCKRTQPKHARRLQCQIIPSSSVGRKRSRKPQHLPNVQPPTRPQTACRRPGRQSQYLLYLIKECFLAQRGGPCLQVQPGMQTAQHQQLISTPYMQLAPPQGRADRVPEMRQHHPRRQRSHRRRPQQQGQNDG